ncbi:uncharacterized protein LOC120559244 [Perca fluviatilis]|uniref:uncharacterized protein LOC120559244 n=1 Tax=Perca fluviatilis TaxID=8168 RepID=UPI0019637ACD|nr:uncharacterized protein LOC120559244 [Perca fluviatilis]
MSEYSGRVQYNSKNKDCTLRISDLRERDSAVYKFRFITNHLTGKYTGSPGVTLSVTGLQVQVNRLEVHDSSNLADLKCQSSCPLPGHPSYIWYKNGQNIQGQTSDSYSASLDPTDSFSCAVRGHEKSRSPSVLIQGQDGLGVTYPSTQICAVKGSTVEIPCSYTYPSAVGGVDTTVERTFWFTKKNNHKPVDLTTDSEYSGRVQYHSENKDCTLRISDLRERDSAVYYFRFTTNHGGNYVGYPGITLSVTVTYSGLQVQVSRLEVYESSKWADLKCQSSCPLPGHPSYIWYKNGQNIQGQTSDSYSASFDPADSFSCAVRGHEDFPSPSVLIQGQNGLGVTYTSTQICAVKGSTVNIPCSYTYPSAVGGVATTVEQRFWFIQQFVDLTTNSEYSGRVQYHSENKDCTLTISDLRERDSAVYYFRFTTNQGGNYVGYHGVTLSVTGLQVQVRRLEVYEFSILAELKCQSSCPLTGHPSYIWYKNGQNIQGQTSDSYSASLDPADSFSCAVRGHEDSPSPSVLIQGQYGLGVTYTSTQICAVKGSTVNIPCSYTYPSAVGGVDTTVEQRVWLSQQFVDLTTVSEYSGRVQYHSENNDCTLRISDLRERDSAVYKFRFTTNQGGKYTGSPGVTLYVTVLQVQVSRFYTSWAELNCQGRCPTGHPSYIWYKNGQNIEGQTSNSYSASLDPADSFSCAVRGHEDSPSPSVVIQGQNGLGVTYTSTQICAVKGSTVNIPCSYTYPSAVGGVDNTVERILWFTKKNNDEPVDLTTMSEYSGRVQYNSKNKDCTLRISDLRERDSAVYKFRFITNHLTGKYTGSPGVTLSVTGLQVQVNRLEVHDSSNLADLKCQSSCPLPGHPSYIWYKNGQNIQGQTSDSYSASLDPTDSFSCAVRGHEKSRSPSVLIKGQNGLGVTYTSTQICAVKGSTVNIPCSYTYPSAVGGVATTVEQSVWLSQQFVDLTTVSEYSGRVQYHSENKDCTLTISDLRERDSAVYYFRFITNQGGNYVGYPGVTLSVTGLQVQVSKSSNQTKLKCQSSCPLPGHPSYIWYKNGQNIQGQTADSYSAYLDPADRYSCAVRGHEDFPSPSVYGPKLPSVSVSPSAEIVEGSSVNLTCSSDANPAANYTWYKENEDSPKASGQIFTITDFRAEHSGNYYCVAQNRIGRQNSTLHLIVVAGTRPLRAAGPISVVLLAVLSLSVFLWIRKRRASRDSSGPDNREQCVPDPSEPEEQVDLQYATIHVSNSQADPLYSNIRAAQPLRHREQQEAVEYAAVSFNSGSTAPRTRGRDTGEDPAALYSTVNYTR